MNTIKINRVTYEVDHDRFDIWLVNPEKLEECRVFTMGYNNILQNALSWSKDYEFDEYYMDRAMENYIQNNFEYATIKAEA